LNLDLTGILVGVDSTKNVLFPIIDGEMLSQFLSLILISYDSNEAPPRAVALILNT
jgi:hypothetical protein